MRLTILVVALVCACACSALPTAPTAQTTQPPPLAMQFVPDTAGSGNTIGVQAGAMAADTIWLGVVADVAEPLYIVRAHLTWNPDLLEYTDQWRKGDWFRGVLTESGQDSVNWSFYLPVTDVGTISLFPTQATMARGVTGQGDVIWFQFRSKGRGQARIALSHLELYGRFAALLGANASGGTVIIR